MLYDTKAQWNIFARELEKILNQHGLTITRLDDLKVVTHPMKVKRLKASLSSPKSLTILNPEEMQRLQEILALEEPEIMTLRAALLATTVERTLMDRTDPYLALMAANDVYRLLHQALINDPASFLAAATKQGVMNSEDDMLGDTLFEDALDLIDRASLSMHLSQESATLQVKVTHAREAYDAYTRALDYLRRSRVPIHEDEDWRECEAESLHGQEQARAIVHQGGEDL